MNNPFYPLAGIVKLLVRIPLLEGALLAGVALRLAIYFSGPMLWLDEAKIALNFAVRSPAELLQPLSFSQTGPVGWLMLTDVLSSALSSFVYGGRLLSVIAGVASMGMFYLIVRQQLSLRVAAVVLLVFGFSLFPVRYSVELKPYIFDLLFALTLIWLSMRAVSPELIKKSWMAVFLVTGIAGVFLSVAAPIVLAGIGSVVILRRMSLRDWAGAFVLSVICVACAVLYLYLSIAFIQPQVAAGGFRAGEMGSFFDRYYAPFPPRNLSEWGWYPQTVYDISAEFFGIYSSFTTLLFALAGFFVLIRSKIWIALILVAPLVVSLILSTAHLYPMLTRLSLYYVPTILILAGFGLEALVQNLSRKSVLPVLAGSLFLLASGSMTTLIATNRIFAPHTADNDISAELIHIRDQFAEGEIIFVDTNALEEFLLYRGKFGLDEKPWAIVGSDPVCIDEATRHLGPNQRAWLLLKRPMTWDDSHVPEVNRIVDIGREASGVSDEQINGRLRSLMLSPKKNIEDWVAVADKCRSPEPIDAFLFGGSAPLRGAAKIQFATPETKTDVN